MSMQDERARLERALLARLRGACKHYALLKPRDRIMVAVSGGKDSYTLLQLLAKLAERLPFSVELMAVHLDQAQPGYDGRPLRRWLKHQGLPFEILREDTYSVVKSHVPDGQTTCALCSRLRRGVLYGAAERLGCNKIALGHHREDALETLLMNLFYAGRIQAMPATYTTDDGAFEVIRPMIECAEPDIARYATLEAFPILPCNLCGTQSGLKRERMKELLTDLERDHPHIKSVMLQALKNVRPTHLLDRSLQAAWQARPGDIRPKPHKARIVQRPRDPVHTSLGKLPVLST